MSLPYLEFLSKQDPTYIATRKLLFSRQNPYYSAGKTFNGIGQVVFMIHITVDIHLSPKWASRWSLAPMVHLVFLILGQSDLHILGPCPIFRLFSVQITTRRSWSRYMLLRMWALRSHLNLSSFLNWNAPEEHEWARSHPRVSIHLRPHVLHSELVCVG